MKIFLTGGTKLLGSYFAELAIAEGADVIALVRPTSNTAHLESLGVTLTKGDLRDVASLTSAMQTCDAVVHLASPKGGWKKPEIYQEITVNGTKNVIAAMEAASITTLVYLSTISVHGLDPIKGKPISEASGFGREFLPYDYYGLAKVRAEKIVKAAHDSGCIQATVLRPGWIYGPRDDSSYGRLADRMRQGVLLKIGTGENRIPLVYASNVAKAIWSALTRTSSIYKVYLYAFDGKTTQNDYFESIARATRITRKPTSISKDFLLSLVTLQEMLSVISGYRIPTLLTRYFIHLFGSDWSFDQRHIEEELKYYPQISYQQGFETTEAWYRKTRGIEPHRQR